MSIRIYEEIFKYSVMRIQTKLIFTLPPTIINVVKRK